MHTLLPCLLRRKKNLCQVLFFVYLFLTSCSSLKERRAEEFLRKFLLEEGGIYTLLGDKPVTDLLIYTGTEKDISLEGLSAESLETVQYVEDSTFENWKAWENFSKNLNFKNFRFIERPCLRDPLHTMYLFVNLEKLKELLRNYKNTFQRELGTNFEIEEVLRELDNPASSFWSAVFMNHCLSGLLHGYGEENCAYFADMMKNETQPTFSEEFIGPIDEKNFPLPLFATRSHDAVIQKYEKQREAIKQIYKGSDFFQKTVQILEQESR
jgi:hypothetical protein